MTMWSGLVSPRIETGSVLLWIRSWTSIVHKIWVISWLGDRLVDSKTGRYATDLLFMSMGETMSLNCGQQRASCSSTSMESPMKFDFWKPKRSERNLSQCHSFYSKMQMDCPGGKHGSPYATPHHLPFQN
jgi:hypothetical protein